MLKVNLYVWSRGKQLVLFSRESSCFPRQVRGKTKLTSFPRDQTLSVLLYITTFPAQHPERATSAELYPGRDTFEFDQGHVTKNQPITIHIID